MSSAVAVYELHGSVCPIMLFHIENAYLSNICRSKVRCWSMSYGMCSQVHSSPWPGLVKIHQATAELHPIMSFYCGNVYLTPICRSEVRHRSMSHEMYGQVHSSFPSSLVKIHEAKAELCPIMSFYSEMHIWPINVGQRSDTGQCHMTCTGKSIHHSHQVWLRSIKLKLNYVQLCHFIVKCIFDP